MKSISLLLATAALIALPFTFMNAQTTDLKSHKIVFEVTMEGPEQWTGALNNVENLRKALGGATKIQVGAHSKGLGRLVAKDNALADRMKTLAGEGVVFAACENSMKKNVTKASDAFRQARGHS